MMIFTKKTEALKMSPGNAGFTLAEVLLTLGIIGIVAAIVIQPLITKIDDEAYKVQYKKLYSTIAQAAEIYFNIDKNSAPRFTNTACTLLTAGDVPGFLNSSNLKVQKSCSNTPGCWHNSDLKWRDGTSFTNNSNSDSVILADGTLIKYYGNVYSGCQLSAVLLADLNGFRAPNILGKDIHALYLINKTSWLDYPNVRTFPQYVSLIDSPKTITSDDLAQNCSVSTNEICIPLLGCFPLPSPTVPKGYTCGAYWLTQ